MASDREPGMHRLITRRDFLEGSVAFTAGLAASGTAFGALASPREPGSAKSYPRG